MFDGERTEKLIEAAREGNRDLADSMDYLAQNQERFEERGIDLDDLPLPEKGAEYFMAGVHFGIHWEKETSD